MPVSIVDHGTNNTIHVNPEHLQKGEGVIEFLGSGNTVSIGWPLAFGMVSIRVGGGGSVIFGENICLTQVYVDAPRGATVRIGDDTWFNSAAAIRADEESGVTIGKGCLIGADARIWSSDMHSIIDATTRRRVNPSREVVIGDRVWLGYGALVLKGSRIGDGSILGAAAVLAGELPSYCAAAGNPAKVLKRGVTWDRQLLPIGQDERRRPDRRRHR